MAITRLSFHTKPDLWPVIKCTCAPYICINAKRKDGIELTKEVSMATIRTNSDEYKGMVIIQTELGYYSVRDSRGTQYYSPK